MNGLPTGVKDWFGVDSRYRLPDRMGTKKLGPKLTYIMMVH